MTFYMLNVFCRDIEIQNGHANHADIKVRNALVKGETSKAVFVVVWTRRI